MIYRRSLSGWKSEQCHCSKDLIIIVYHPFSMWGQKKINKLTDWYLWTMSHRNTILTRCFLSISILNNDRLKTRGCTTSVNHLHQLVYRNLYFDRMNRENHQRIIERHATRSAIRNEWILNFTWHLCVLELYVRVF